MEELNQDVNENKDEETSEQEQIAGEKSSEEIKSQNNAAEESFVDEQTPVKEKNFFEEENYYDTHPLPQQAPPPVYQQGYIPPQQQYRQPQAYYQPPQQQYHQSQQQYQQPHPQQQAYQQQYQQQYSQPQQGQQPNNGQFMPPPPKYPQQNYYAQPRQPEPNNASTAVTAGRKGLPTGAIVGIIIVGLLIIGLISAIAILQNKGNINNIFESGLGSHAESEKVADEQSTVDIPTQSKPDVDEKYTDSDGRYTTQGIAKVVSPSVVGIVVYGQDQSLEPVSQASGIIISADGYIATNAHVVEGAYAQKVILSDGTEYEATIVGRDSKSDLAVLKIEKTDKIVAAQLGNSDELELGEQVMAIGNPGGFSNSITGGYVSGLDRMIKSSDTGLDMSCIQTDAAVNPGNSGGALVNMFGQVVGIISSKLVATDYEGIGFAISINEALPIIQDIIAKGYVSDRVKIGIVFAELTDTTADMYEVVPGLYVSQIDPTCDIANSGLQVYDIITEMNGQKVYNYDTVMKAISGMKPGDTVTAKVYRKSIIKEVTEFEIKFKLMEDTTAQ